MALKRAFWIVPLLGVIKVRFDTLKVLNRPESLYLFEFVIQKVLVGSLGEDFGHGLVTENLLFEFVAVDPEHLSLKRHAFDRARLVAPKLFNDERYFSKDLAGSISRKFNLLPLDFLLREI